VPTALLPLKVGCRSVELIKKVQRVAFDFNVGEQGHETSLELLVELHITGQGAAHQQSDPADRSGHSIPSSAMQLGGEWQNDEPQGNGLRDLQYLQRMLAKTRELGGP